MPLPADRVPLITRLSVRLAKHGLSFGDGLNVALFLLTLLSLLLAYWGVHLAKVTLNDARREADKAHRDADEASRKQETQFQQQMKELKTSTETLETARGLLKDQADTLRNLQGISERQLANQNKSEARVERQERARPLPGISIICNGFRFVDISGPDTPGRRHTSHLKIHRKDTGNINCIVFLKNDGDKELDKVNLQIQVHCPESPDDALFVERNGITVTPPAASLDFFTDENIPADSMSVREFRQRFVLRPSANCSSFDLSSRLESNDSPEIDTLSFIEVTK